MAVSENDRRDKLLIPRIVWIDANSEPAVQIPGTYTVATSQTILKSTLA